MLGWSLQTLSIRYIYSVSLPSVLLYVAMNVVLHGRLYKSMNIVACVCASIIFSIVSLSLHDHVESVLLTDYDRFPQTLQRETSSKTSGLCQHTAVSLVQ